MPILETLKCLFKNKHFAKEYLDYNANHRCRDGVYERFCCGQNFKKNELFQANRNAMQIQIFFDDFQLTAPLKTKPHKVCAIYFIIHNFPPNCVSQLKNMYLICLCDSKVVDNNGCNAILEQFVHDIKNLETEGISINNDLRLKGTLVQVSFDNLGGNTIFGVVRCFISKYYCRICYCEKKICQISTREIANDLRTVDQYNHLMPYVRKLIDSHKKPDFKETLGITNYCVLNDLNYFHSIVNRSQDMMHDIYEGAMSFTLAHLFKYFSDNKIIISEDIAKKVLLFDYGKLERQNKPSPIFLKKSNLNQNASQMHCLMLHIPFIFVGLLSHESESQRKAAHKGWKVVEYLLKINQIFSSTVIKEADLVNLENYTAEFLKSIQSIFKTHLIPKLHFMTHYANTIRAMGPLIKIQMMRGDGKHQKFTRYAKRTNNFINICKTLSEKHQQEVVSHLRMNTFSDVIKTSKITRKLVDKNGSLIDEFDNKSELSNISEMFVK